jgi:hypothetical protein
MGPSYGKLLNIKYLGLNGLVTRSELIIYKDEEYSYFKINISPNGFGINENLEEEALNIAKNNGFEEIDEEQYNIFKNEAKEKIEYINSIRGDIENYNLYINYKNYEISEW